MEDILSEMKVVRTVRRIKEGNWCDFRSCQRSTFICSQALAPENYLLRQQPRDSGAFEVSRHSVYVSMVSNPLIDAADHIRVHGDCHSDRIQ